MANLESVKMQGQSNHADLRRHAKIKTLVHSSEQIYMADENITKKKDSLYDAYQLPSVQLNSDDVDP